MIGLPSETRVWLASGTTATDWVIRESSAGFSIRTVADRRPSCDCPSSMTTSRAGTRHDPADQRSETRFECTQVGSQ